MARQQVLDHIIEFIGDVSRGEVNNFDLMRRSVALSTEIKIALDQVNRTDYPVFVEALKEYQERILRLVCDRFVQKPDKPKWRFKGRDDENRLRFVCDTGEERLIPADRYWKR